MRGAAQLRWRLVALGVLALVTLGLVLFAVLRARPVTVAVVAPGSSAPQAQSGPSASAEVTVSPSLTPSFTASPTATSTAPGFRVVVVGDGYSAADAWPRELANTKGWQVTTLSEGGMGYRMVPASCTNQPCVSFRGLVRRVVELQPDAVVVAGGEADGDYDLEPFVLPLLSDLTRQLPSTKVVALSPPPSAQVPRPYWLGMHARTLEEAASQAGVTLLDVSRVTNRGSSYSDGRLTPAANAAVAALVAAELD